MKLLLLLLLLLIVCVFIFGSNIEKFWSRPNKCFDCEKQITNTDNAYLSFPAKCFDCEKNNLSHQLGPTKCFDCENKKNTEQIIQNKNYSFSLFGRNTQFYRK